MLNKEQKDDFSSLRIELIDLNILACLYIRKFNRIGFLFKETTRHYILEELTALRYMENGLILHLTNLDDDSSNFSFRKILKAINTTIKDQEVIKNLKSDFDSFRRNVNSLKVKHRNKRIAHLNYTEDLNLDQFLNFDNVLKPLISQANVIGDKLWGERIKQEFKLGTYEGILNFRELFKELKADINSQKEFV
ncbi:hypothetical protein [Luteibaculum oceani]|uniref:HEPN AbiU2-like domain-containing protein n=1 Tax=Luteibaculum oceani TaxID=1294296 RepID=A0A5C6UXY7_9FLAO|nr:hypothetical protein [Luteibaculum oceani]TXC78353.1 hypothetical protein FRX97_08465 [Luteibaculum oceani]